MRRPKPIDVWCPACKAAPWQECVSYVPPNGDGRLRPGGPRSHERRRAVARRLARELGFPPAKVLKDEYGHFRAAKR
jgi:hypothetical protein